MTDAFVALSSQDFKGEMERIQSKTGFCMPYNIESAIYFTLLVER